MKGPLIDSGKYFLWICIPFLALSFSTLATAATTSPKPGGYCPDKDILLVIAEELSASLDMAMRSRVALRNKDQATVIRDLASAGTLLHLAASRGAAARTILLIDAIIQGRVGEDDAQILAWFPLLQTSLLTLPDDTTASAASDWIGRAEDIMQGDRGGDAMKSLKEARHMLACDGLDIPLQQAIQAQDKLMKQFGRNNAVKNTAFDGFLDSLRNALVYTLESSER